MPAEKLHKLEAGSRVALLTYKKDRKVIIVKREAQLYDVHQEGFETRTYTDIDSAHLAKLLKQLQRIEFPRSHKFFLEIMPAGKPGKSR